MVSTGNWKSPTMMDATTTAMSIPGQAGRSRRRPNMMTVAKMPIPNASGVNVDKA
jgi:hypothetical protein